MEKIKKQLEKEKQIEIERIRKDEKEAYERRFQELLQSTFKLNFVAEGTFATAIDAGHGATTSSGAGVTFLVLLTSRIQKRDFLCKDKGIQRQY